MFKLEFKPDKSFTVTHFMLVLGFFIRIFWSKDNPAERAALSFLKELEKKVISSM